MYYYVIVLVALLLEVWLTLAIKTVDYDRTPKGSKVRVYPSGSSKIKPHM